MEDLFFVPLLHICVYEVIQDALSNSDAITNSQITEKIIASKQQMRISSHQRSQLLKRVSHCTAKLESAGIIERSDFYTGKKKVPTKVIVKLHKITQ